MICSVDGCGLVVVEGCATRNAARYLTNELTCNLPGPARMAGMAALGAGTSLSPPSTLSVTRATRWLVTMLLLPPPRQRQARQLVGWERGGERRGIVGEDVLGVFVRMQAESEGAMTR